MRMQFMLICHDHACGHGYPSKDEVHSSLAALCCFCMCVDGSTPCIFLPTRRGNYECTSSTCVVDRGMSVSCTKADYYLSIKIVLACNLTVW